MRQAFVLKLGAETEGARRHFEGTIEEESPFCIMRAGFADHSQLVSESP
jgi:hypothetical protein